MAWTAEKTYTVEVIVSVTITENMLDDYFYATHPTSDSGPNRIGMIKLVREASLKLYPSSRITLKDAKEIVDDYMKKKFPMEDYDFFRLPA